MWQYSTANLIFNYDLVQNENYHYYCFNFKGICCEIFKHKDVLEGTSKVKLSLCLTN
jgi:hypothetical protein